MPHCREVILSIITWLIPFGQPSTTRADRVDRVDRLQPLIVHEECTFLTTKKYRVKISRKCPQRQIHKPCWSRTYTPKSLEPAYMRAAIVSSSCMWPSWAMRVPSTAYSQTSRWRLLCLATNIAWKGPSGSCDVRQQSTALMRNMISWYPMSTYRDTYDVRNRLMDKLG